MTNCKVLVVLFNGLFPMYNVLMPLTQNQQLLHKQIITTDS